MQGFSRTQSLPARRPIVKRLLEGREVNVISIGALLSSVLGVSEASSSSCPHTSPAVPAEDNNVFVVMVLKLKWLWACIFLSFKDRVQALQKNRVDTQKKQL